MGYLANQLDTKFTISNRNHLKALQALKKMAEEYIETGEYLLFIDPERVLKCETLFEAMLCCGWVLYIDHQGNVIKIIKKGAKLGDDGIVFEYIAPFVDKYSYIKMEGEDGKQWKLIFKYGILQCL